jgi:tRNA threonylcarbamoyladenosine modification (KEOPS) complex Cgi121 subunit
MRVISDGNEDEDSVRISSDFSVEELELAYHLAEDAFSKEKNIAKEKKLEFLLWLTGTRDIKNALKKAGDGCLVVLDGPKVTVNEPGLKEKPEPEKLEKISLSRI